MKTTIIKKVIPLIIVAVVEFAITTSCEKEKNGSSDCQSTNPPIVQTDTTNIGTNHRIVLSLSPDSIRNLLIGSWKEKYYGWHNYYSDDDLRDTLTFLGSDSTVLDKTGIYTNCSFRVLSSNTIAFYKDTSVFINPFEFPLSLDTITNEYELYFTGSLIYA